MFAFPGQSERSGCAVLDAPDIHGVHTYRNEMATSFNLSNSTAGIATRCAAANMGQEWRCIFAEYAFPFVETPLFALESLYDSWQIPNVSAAAPFSSCSEV